MQQVLPAVFRRGGPKKELFGETTGNISDGHEELMIKMAELAELWAAPRAGKDLSAAIWRPELGMAEVVLQRKAQFDRMGVRSGKRLHLNIEEAVHAVDTGILLLFLADANGKHVLLSFQDAVDLMASLSISYSKYQVYSLLMKEGYIVRRYPSCWGGSRARGSEAPSWHGGPAWHGGDRITVGAALPAKQTGELGNADPPTSRRAPVSTDCQRLAVSAAIPHKRSADGSASDSQHDLAGCRDHSGTGPSSQEALQQLQAALPRLRPVRTASFSQRECGSSINPIPTACPNSLCLVYDVYKPNTKFVRHTPDPVQLRVAVREDGRVPSPAQWDAAQRESGLVPVVQAVCQQGDVAFYRLAGSESLLSMKQAGSENRISGH